MNAFARARLAKIDHSIFLIKVNHVGTAIIRGVLTNLASLGKNGICCRLSSSISAISHLYVGLLRLEAEEVSF